MTPELSTEELQSLHREATDLYDTYFRSNAKHKVNVSQDIAMNIFKSECFVQFRWKLRSYINTPHIIYPYQLKLFILSFSFEWSRSQRHSIKNYDTIVYGI